MTMEFRIITAVLAITLGSSMQAQTPTDSNRAKNADVTVTGCVERADQMPAAATLGTTVDSQTFLLVPAKEPADQPTGTSSRTGRELGTVYRLDADASKLNPHVGHRVEIAGTVDSAPLPLTTGAASDSAPSTVRQLRVESVKMLSQTCAR
jgi:hypothetical protein